MVTGEDRVKAAKTLVVEGRVHPQGCSQLVCEVLGITWEDANSLLGDAPTAISADYHELTPGDVVGWKKQPHGHVAIFIGDDSSTFIDVQGDNQVPRGLSSYGPATLVKSSKY